jgi:prepilin peptidase CpaA
MLAEILVVAFVPVLLAVAGVWDLASFTIPNFLSIALIGLFAVFAFAAGLTLPAVGLHLLAGLAGLVLGFGLFAMGWIGGGDAKLFAAVALWLGFHDLLNYALLASVFGGVLTLALLALRRLPLPVPLVRQAWALRLHDARSGIPYGVALAIGAFVLLPSTEIFRLAVAA